MDEAPRRFQPRRPNFGSAKLLSSVVNPESFVSDPDPARMKSRHIKILFLILGLWILDTVHFVQVPSKMFEKTFVSSVK